MKCVIGNYATASSMAGVTTKPSIGFGAIEARYQTIFSAIELPKLELVFYIHFIYSELLAGSSAKCTSQFRCARLLNH